MWSVETSPGCVSRDHICLGCCYFPVLHCLTASWFPSCSPWWRWAGLALFVISSPHSSFRTLFISPCYSLELYIQLGISFPFSFASCFSFSAAVCKPSSHNHFAFLHFFFFGMVLVTASCTVLCISIHSSSGTLSIRSNQLNLCHLHCATIRDLI